MFTNLNSSHIGGNLATSILLLFQNNAKMYKVVFTSFCCWQLLSVRQSLESGVCGWIKDKHIADFESVIIFFLTPNVWSFLAPIL